MLPSSAKQIADWTRSCRAPHPGNHYCLLTHLQLVSDSLRGDLGMFGASGTLHSIVESWNH